MRFGVDSTITLRNGAALVECANLVFSGLRKSFSNDMWIIRDLQNYVINGAQFSQLASSLGRQNSSFCGLEAMAFSCGNREMLIFSRQCMGRTVYLTNHRHQFIYIPGKKG